MSDPDLSPEQWRALELLWHARVYLAKKKPMDLGDRCAWALLYDLSNWIVCGDGVA